MKTRLVKVFLLWLLLSTPMLFAQEIGEGLWGGYEGEWEHVSSQLIALAETTPTANFAWRGPRPFDPAAFPWPVPY